ncbi:hypothetical protein AaE_007458 [Aphanomyces astaci]|uniref:DDE Tnp4 domain-containing protein n=1 Tax=Aphanomyces astaci TaxID=112090 RepID=A0A6A5AHX9_APHAT|nr:hypothetical protein AaE_007458 [Aphanomyces astaci]
MRVTSIIESLQEQHAVDQINLAECLRTHGDTIDQHDDLSESAHPIIDAILEESGCDDPLRVSSDRVVVENYFGCVCQLWKVSYATFTWGHNIFDGILRLTFALTNYHVTLMPLRANDRVTYRSVLARYQAMSKAYIDRRNETQRRSRRRRAERDLMGSAIGRRMSSLNDSLYSRRLPSQNNSPTLR